MQCLCLYSCMIVCVCNLFVCNLFVCVLCVCVFRLSTLLLILIVDKAVDMLTSTSGYYYNTAAVVNDKGQLLCNYRKVFYSI